MQNQKLLLDLAALVDLRLGVLNRDWPEEVKKLDLEQYLERENDDFSQYGVAKSEFDFALKHANLGTLKTSPVTRVVEVIMEVLQQYRLRVCPAAGSPLEVDINVWPFDLDPDIREMYALLLEHALGGVVKVNTVSAQPKSLTLGTLKKKYHTFIIYDWVRWATAIEQSFRNETAPTLTVIVPKLLQGETIPPPEEMTKELRAGFAAAHPTAYMEFMLQDIVGLNFEDVRYFSIKT